MSTERVESHVKLEGEIYGVLRELIKAKAGVREYWIADASTGTASLEIFCLGEEGYAPVHLTDGWQSSAVFGKELRLEQKQSPIDMTEYDLRVR